MSDDCWPMPRGWPFSAVELTARGLVVVPEGRNARLVPWRLMRRVERPGDGFAVLRLGDGEGLLVPDHNHVDVAWLHRIAELADAAGATPACDADYAAVVQASIAQHGDVQKIGADGDSTATWGCAVPVSLLFATFPLMVLQRDGLGWTLLGATLAAALAIRGVLKAALGARTGRGKSSEAGRVVFYQVLPGGLRFGLSNRENQDVPFGQVRSVRTHGTRTHVRLHGSPPVILNGVQEPLVRLYKALHTLRSGRFEGIDAEPPTAASISRITGHESEAADRGISLAAADREGEDA